MVFDEAGLGGEIAFEENIDMFGSTGAVAIDSLYHVALSTEAVVRGNSLSSCACLTVLVDRRLAGKATVRFSLLEECFNTVSGLGSQGVVSGLVSAVKALLLEVLRYVISRHQKW